MFDEAVSVEAVRRFCELAVERLGLAIDPKLEPLIAGRVAKRLKTLQVPVDEYLSQLDGDVDCSEVVQFLDFVRPRASRLFARWPDHAELHARMRRWLRAGRRRFRLWSAGCGSGEEAYSMALIVENAMEVSRLDPDAVDIKILATDISRHILERGKRGLFDEAQAQEVPSRLRARYFTQTSAGLALAEQVKSRVVFRRLNLANPPYPMSGLLDAVFCHEGLLSLVPAARARMVRAARALLPDDGLLCTGLDAVESDFANLDGSSHLDPNRAARWSGHC